MNGFTKKLAMLAAAATMAATGMFGLVSQASPAGAATVRCSTAAYEQSTKNVFGQKVTGITGIVRYCYNGSTITAVSTSASHFEQYLNYWKGISNHYTEGGVGSTYFKFMVQGKWSVCYPSPWGAVCPSNSYNTVIVTVRGTGAQGATGYSTN